MKTGHQMPKRRENAKDSNEIRWKWSSFEELSKVELYDILQIRQQIFVLEQNCLYQDIDRLDQSAWHLLAINKNAQLMGYLRVVAPGKKYKEPSIGRVLVHPDQRRNGLG
ncbi:MAG: GNAT family N-acetyltransferase, partial [Cyanobacteria bacterium J06632_3]